MPKLYLVEVSCHHKKIWPDNVLIIKQYECTCASP